MPRAEADGGHAAGMRRMRQAVRQAVRPASSTRRCGRAALPPADRQDRPAPCSCLHTTVVRPHSGMRRPSVLVSNKQLPCTARHVRGRKLGAGARGSAGSCLALRKFLAAFTSMQASAPVVLDGRHHRWQLFEPVTAPAAGLRRAGGGLQPGCRRLQAGPLRSDHRCWQSGRCRGGAGRGQALIGRPLQQGSAGHTRGASVPHRALYHLPSGATEQPPQGQQRPARTARGQSRRTVEGGRSAAWRPPPRWWPPSTSPAAPSWWPATSRRCAAGVWAAARSARGTAVAPPGPLLPCPPAAGPQGRAPGPWTRAARPPDGAAHAGGGARRRNRRRGCSASWLRAAVLEPALMAGRLCCNSSGGPG